MADVTNCNSGYSNYQAVRDEPGRVQFPMCHLPMTTRRWLLEKGGEVALMAMMPEW